MRSFVLFLFLASASCSRKNGITLSFFNKSSHVIDSILIDADKPVKLGKINAGEKLAYNFPDVKITSGREGQFTFRVFTQEKVLTGGWGFHWFGYMAGDHEEYYIYDNGFGYKNGPRPKPKEFMLYFYNFSDKKVDSIFSNNNSIIKIVESTPRSYHITYDYNKIEDNPIFLVSMQGKHLNKKLISHDFTNWNDTQAFVHFHIDTIATGPSPVSDPLEFIVDLEVRIADSLSAITLESPAITKVYDIHQPKYKKVVFDFKKLKVDPIFYINTKSKRYQVDLSKHDFSNIYVSQKIYFLEEGGVRSFSD